MSARISRRHFFFGSLLAGAVPAGGFGSTPSLTAAGFKSFNEKLNIAGIGCGIRSGQILPQAAVSENIVAHLRRGRGPCRARLRTVSPSHEV